MLESTSNMNVKMRDRWSVSLWFIPENCEDRANSLNRNGESAIRRYRARFRKRNRLQFDTDPFALDRTLDPLR
jgi:hypothetical protein